MFRQVCNARMPVGRCPPFDMTSSIARGARPKRHPSSVHGFEWKAVCFECRKSNKKVSLLLIHYPWLSLEPHRRAAARAARPPAARGGRPLSE